MNNITILNNRVIDENGNVVYLTDALMELLYQGKTLENILCIQDDKDVQLFNRLSYENYDEITLQLPTKLPTHQENQNNWFYPDQYDNINLYDYFINLTKTLDEHIRTEIELELYEKHNMIKFLRFCIFFSDTIKEKNLVVGVGRGSSCASLLLYLLKINLVNPLDYNLDIKEFIKE